MHLSRLLLNPRSNEVRRDFSNVHNLHRRVLCAFPDERLQSARSHFQVLFRSEFSPEGAPLLLVQSEAEPRWGALPNSYLEASFEPNPATKPLAGLLERVAAGSAWRFRLRANPTKRVRTGTSVAGRRVGVWGHEPLMQWLARRAESSGFRPAASSWQHCARVAEERRVSGSRNGAKLTFASALFEGTLQVTDKERFLSALKHGIGSAKGYGFGLLSVAPAGGVGA